MFSDTSIPRNFVQGDTFATIISEEGFIPSEGFYLVRDFHDVIHEMFLLPKELAASWKEKGMKGHDGIIYIHKNSQYQEMYYFGIFPSKGSSTYAILESKTFLMTYIHYFLAAARKTIHRLRLYKYNLPTHTINPNNLLSTIDLKDCSDDVKHYRLPAEGEDVFLTKREFEIINLWKDGLTMDQIASVSNIAHSTVKTHIENVKSKLAVTTKEQIINLIESSIYS